jgi:hypothetical protein
LLKPRWNFPVVATCGRTGGGRADQPVSPAVPSAAWLFTLPATIAPSCGLFYLLS